MPTESTSNQDDLLIDLLNYIVMKQESILDTIALMEAKMLIMEIELKDKFK